MKIGINARLLVKPYTGIGQHTRNLFRELARLDLKNKYILIVPEKIDSKIEKEFPDNVDIVVIPEKKIGTAGMKKTWWEQIQIPEYFQKIKADVVFFPYPCNPWTSDWYKSGIKTIVTVHDAIPWTNKKYLRGILSKMYHSQTKKAVKKADQVLTVSEKSKKDVMKICGVDGEKITVVYNDASDVYKSEPDEDYADEVLKKFGLRKNWFFLYVGGYDERKNVKRLAQEYSVFAEKKITEEVLPLVLAGGKLFDNKLYKSFDDESVDGEIVRTGFLEEEELNVLYRNCRAFIHLSEDEGFNIPVVEAANCNAPLILSDIEVHREVAGTNALFVDLNEEGSVVTAMEKIMEDELIDHFMEESYELAGKYSWKKSAQTAQDVLSSFQLK